MSGKKRKIIQKPGSEDLGSMAGIVSDKARKIDGKPKNEGSALMAAIANLKKIEEANKTMTVQSLKDLQKEFKAVITKTKREAEEFERSKTISKPSRNRSGRRRGASAIKNKQNGTYADGKWITKGMDDAQEKFADDELEFLEKDVRKKKSVGDLGYEHIKYLVAYKFIDELRAIKRGDLKSTFHDRYHELIGKSHMELESEVRTTLFTNEQRDYINGLLQELFDANKKDDKDQIRHMDIKYVKLVMLKEVVLRIVKFVHKLETDEETEEYMKKSSRQAHNISEDEE